MTPDERAGATVPDACTLVCLVRDVDPAVTGSWLQARTREQLEALCVVLAAMVPDDRSPGDLLAWIDPGLKHTEKRHQDALRKRRARNGTPAPRLVQPCGTHAAFNRHVKAGEDPCLRCLTAEREYQAERHERRKAARQSLRRTA